MIVNDNDTEKGSFGARLRAGRTVLASCRGHHADAYRPRPIHRRSGASPLICEMAVDGIRSLSSSLRLRVSGVRSLSTVKTGSG